MAMLLGLTIFSFFFTIILLIPFIDFLYKIKLRRQHQVTKDMFNQHTPLFDKFHTWKVGTPIGGGILIIFLTSIITMWAYGILSIPVKPWELFVIFFSFISFGLLGLYDDAKKLTVVKAESFFGLRFRHKFIIQWILALVIATVSGVSAKTGPGVFNLIAAATIIINGENIKMRTNAKKTSRRRLRSS